MIEVIYILTEDVNAHGVCPKEYGGWEGVVKKGTPVVLTHFECYSMDFWDGYNHFQLGKPCPVVPACSCDICSEIIPTTELANHKATSRNCKLCAESGEQ